MATVRYLDRKLVRNIIRHTETHNRLQEEEEMWRSRAQEAFGWKHRPSSRRERGRKRSRERNFRFDGQMDRFQRVSPDSRSPQNHWSWNSEQNRNIYRKELGNQERWGHAGFMELYPEEFINKDSMDEMSDGGDKEERRKKKMKRKHKRRRESKQESSSSKRRKDGEGFSSSSESDMSSPSSDEQHAKTSTAKKRTHSSQHSEHTKHRSEHRRVPSFDRSESRNHGHARSKDDTSYHKRAPFSSKKSNHELRDSKRKTSEDRKEWRNKDTKVNGHRSKDRIHRSPDSPKTKSSHGTGLHRRRNGDKPETPDKRRHKELTKMTSAKEDRMRSSEKSYWSEGRDRSNEDDRGSGHHHKSSKKAKKRNEEDKDIKHGRRK